MTNVQTIDSLRAIAAEARLRQKAERRADLLAVQSALRRYAATFEEAPVEFAVRVLLESDTVLPQVGPDQHGSGPTRETSQVLIRPGRWAVMSRRAALPGGGTPTRR